VICHNTFHLDPDTARRVAGTILPEAPELTTGQIAARLRTLSIQVDPADAHRRYKHGLSDRKVVAEPNCDGTADLIGCNLLPIGSPPSSMGLIAWPWLLMSKVIGGRSTRRGLMSIWIFWKVGKSRVRQIPRGRSTFESISPP
jgi:hypothetical protein